MPTKKPATAGRSRTPSGYDFSATRRGALSGITGPSFAEIATRDVAEQKKRPKSKDSIRSAPKPRGVLTRMAADAVSGISKALGSSERDAAQRASRVEEFSHNFNPLTAVDEIGTQIGYGLKGDRDFNKGVLAEATAATALGFGAGPAAKALAKTKAGKAITGALSKSAPIVDDPTLELAAKSRTVAPRARTGDVRTKDGAVVTPAPERPRGALSEPDDTMIPLRHYSHKRDLAVVDPSSMGSNPSKNMSREERRALKRGYFGVNRNQPGDYNPDQDIGIGNFSYDAEIPARKMVEVGSPLHKQFIAQAEHIMDRPELLRAWDLPSAADGQRVVETLQQAAGFPARYFGPEYTPYGAAVHSFEPVAVKRTAEEALKGQPLKLDAQGPHRELRDAARDYMHSVRGPRYRPSDEYLQVDPQRGETIAQAYEAMEHSPNDPQVRKAYEALSKETLTQYEALKREGYQFSFYPRDEAGEIVDPYASPFDALRDIRGPNKTMQVFPTDYGYGAGGITDDMVAENPMLALVPNETWGDQPVRVNDAFRAVHDAFGHAKDGVGFRAGGEENAWNAHRTMFTPQAQKALATETRGQNSWLNFGPNGAANRNASTADTVFADQKIGLLPDWVLDPNGMPEGL